MNELIKIDDQNGIQTVNARDLHAALGVGRDFSSWIRERFEKFGFVEHEDYFSFPQIGGKPQGGRPAIEYSLTIGTAKELAMVENNERGRAVRRYFIEVERRYHARHESPEAQVARALITAHQIIEQQKPLVEFARSVHAAKNGVLVREFAKVLTPVTGEKRFYEWLRTRGYLRPGSTEPYQRYVDQGLFELKEHTYATPSGTMVKFVTQITGKGQAVLERRWREGR